MALLQLDGQEAAKKFIDEHEIDLEYDWLQGVILEMARAGEKKGLNMTLILRDTVDMIENGELNE